MPTGRASPLAIILTLLLLGSLHALLYSQESDILDRDIYLQLTVRDIATADLYQLIDWCRILDLDHRGGVDTLRSRLYAYYGHDPSLEAADTGPPDETQRITIRSADTTRYFTLEAREEGYVEISGGVELELYSPAEGSTHSIRADRLLYNQSTGDISASGNVRYALGEGDTQEETFFGESLTVNLGSWESRFLKGYTLQDRTINEQEITFTFFGETIARSPQEILSLEEGSITSSQMEDPSYRIEADQIWVFEPGEWLLNGATFYLGRVPVLYFPFFFQLRDKMLINPSFGFDQRDGAYLQTTTYLYGAQPKSDEESLSFLQLAEDEDAGRVTEIRGLYRRTKENPTTEEIAAARRAEERGEYVRVLFDYYSRLGLLGAVDLSLQREGLLESAELFAGAGRTRLVSEFSPFTFSWQDPDLTDPISLWEGSWFGAVYLPLRFQFDSALSGSAGGFSYDLTLPYESDPRLSLLYDERRESIDWGTLLAISDPLEETSSSSLPSGFTWRLKTAYNANVGTLSPWINQLRVTELSTQLDWRYGTISGSPAEIEELLPNWDAVPSYLQDEYASRYFPYPESTVLPKLNLTIGGQLYPFPESDAVQADPAGDTGEELIPPWEGGTPSESGPKSEEILSPENPDSFAIPLDGDLGQGSSLSYLLTPRLTHGINYDIYGWDDGENALYTSPKAVDFDTAYTVTTIGGDAKLNYAGDYFNNLWSLEDSVGYSLQEKSRTRTIDSSIPNYDVLEESDKQSSYQRLSHSLVLTNRPFIHSAIPVDQTFEYRLQHFLYTKEYEAQAKEFQTELFPWERDSIQQQQISSVTAYDLGPVGNTSTVKGTLPPLLGEIDLSHTSELGPLRFIGTGGFEEIDDGDWEPKSASLDGKWSFNDYSFLRQKIELDENEDRRNFRLREGESEAAAAAGDNRYGISSRIDYWIDEEDDSDRAALILPESWETKAWLDEFWTSYTMEYIFPVSLQTGTGWVQESEREFIPSTYSFGYQREFEPEPRWKNRINLRYGIDTGYTQDLNRFSDTTFFFKTALNFRVHQFLDLQFSSYTENTSAFRYFPWLIEGTEISGVNPVEDLIRSINIFDVDDRRRSNFNLRSIDLKAVHHLDQWDLTVEYTGEPVQETEDGFPVYRWQSNFSIYVQWNPIPELERRVDFEDGELFL